MGLTGWCIVVRQRLLKLFTLCQVKSDLVETWFEWYDNKGLQSYGADFEYLHQLDRRGPQNTLELFQPRGSLLCDSVTNAIKNMSFISSNIVSGTFWVKNRTSRDSAIGTYQIIESSCVGDEWRGGKTAVGAPHPQSFDCGGGVIAPSLHRVGAYASSNIIIANTWHSLSCSFEDADNAGVENTYLLRLGSWPCGSLVDEVSHPLPVVAPLQAVPISCRSSQECRTPCRLWSAPVLCQLLVPNSWIHLQFCLLATSAHDHATSLRVLTVSDKACIPALQALPLLVSSSFRHDNPKILGCNAGETHRRYWLSLV